ncbi:CD1375 family protein [Paenibacillus sp. GCM10027626]
MVTVYVTLIVKGAKKYEQVPANLQPAVKAELAVMDLDTDGKPLAA